MGKILYTKTYDLNKFYDACNTKKVAISYDAQKWAADHGLFTENDLKSFIYNRGFKNEKYIHTKEWELNPDKSEVILVDSYSCIMMAIPAYFAFLFPKKGKWFLKSLKDLDVTKTSSIIPIAKTEPAKKIGAK